MDYSSLLSSDDELDKIENVSIEDESLHLRYYSSGEDENSNKRQRVETSTSDTMTGACGGPEDNIPDESMSSVNDSVLECSSVSVSRSSTPSVQMNSRTPTNLASTPCSSRSIIPTFLRTPLSGDVRSSRSPTPVTDGISRKDQTTGSANKIDTLTSEVIKMKRQLVKVQENQSNVEKKVDILIQMLHSKTDAPKKGSQKINVPAQIAIDTLTSEVIKMKRQLVKVQENQSNVEKKVDILIQMLHSKTDAPKKGSQKINVPAQIAQSIRCGFQQGMTEKDFIWKTKNEAGNILKYNSAENKEMSDFIIEFVKGQYPDEVEGVVREGIKTNFESFKAKKRREETGKQEEHNKKMAVYSRLKRKLNNRKKALKEKSSMPKEQKETVMQSMEIQYMSSEQTDSEDEGSFIVRPLPWRSDDFDKLVKKLDQKHENKLSKRSRRQNNIRKVGAVSSRKKPEVVPGHEWVFR